MNQIFFFSVSFKRLFFPQLQNPRIPKKCISGFISSGKSETNTSIFFRNSTTTKIFLVWNVHSVWLNSKSKKVSMTYVNFWSKQLSLPWSWQSSMARPVITYFHLQEANNQNVFSFKHVKNNGKDVAHIYKEWFWTKSQMTKFKSIYKALWVMNCFSSYNPFPQRWKVASLLRHYHYFKVEYTPWFQ